MNKSTMTTPPSAEDKNHIQYALELEDIDVNLYRSKHLWIPLGNRGVFGGQVVGQALAAAVKTVSPLYQVHSLHSYFLLPGDATQPIIYRVYRVREGKTYVTRNVAARQNGRVIFGMMVSFAREEKSSLVYQHPMPEVPAPETLKSTEQRLREWLQVDSPDVAKFHSTIEMRLQQPFPIDVRPIPRKQLGLEKNEPKQMLWVKAKGLLPSDPAFHHCVLAFVSDHELLNTSLIPHGLARYGAHRRLTFMTSLDHAIWFHAPYRADEWLLYVLESSRSNSGRGYATGRVYTQDGRLVISTAQEGVIRYKEATPPSQKSKI